MPARVPLSVIALLLGGCAPALEYSTTPDPDACRASELQGLVGQPLAGFDAASAEGPVRIIGPGAAVTMDFLEFRLNILHDSRQIITQVTCG